LTLAQREGKLTLRTFKVESKPAPVLLEFTASMSACAPSCRL